MDSTPTIVACIQAAARDLGLPVPDNRAASYVIGLGLQDAMQAAMPDLDPRHYPRMVERYKHHYLTQDQSLVLFDGAREMLHDLSAQGYFLGLLQAILADLEAGCDEQRIPLFLIVRGGRCADLADEMPYTCTFRVVTGEELAGGNARHFCCP